MRLLNLSLYYHAFFDQVSPVMSPCTHPICKGVKKDGQPCKFRGRFGGYCKFHEPCKECSICLETVTKGSSTMTRCNHVYHSACLERWLATNSSCPMCRACIRPAPPPVPNYNPDHSHGMSMANFIQLNNPRVLTITMDPFTFTENGQTFHSAGTSFELDVSYLWE